MTILSFPEADVPPDLRAQVARLQLQAWPEPGPAAPGPVHDSRLRPVTMLLVDGPRVLSALDVLSKTIEHDGASYAASGLSTVVTEPALRGRGHGSRLVVGARVAIAASGADLGIFTCDPPLRAFYERCGWQLLPGTVLVGGTPASPLPSDRLGKVVLGAFFSERAQARARVFLGSRVALYPGEIDRLW